MDGEGEGEVDKRRNSIKSPLPSPTVPQSPIQASLPPPSDGREGGRGGEAYNPPLLTSALPDDKDGGGPVLPDSTAKSCTVQENPVQYRFFKDILESKWKCTSTFSFTRN